MINSQDLYRLFNTQGPSWSASSVSIDTRTLTSGALFVALEGASSDGHEFVEKAKESGAVAALVSKPVETSLPTLCVPNTFKALQEIAVYRRSLFKGKVLALTGSVGKTSVKEGLRHALGEKAFVTAGNLNSQIGVPLSLAHLDLSTDIGIFELGMTETGQIRKLTSFVQPDVSMITEVTAQHMLHFSSVEGIAHAKAEIYTQGSCKVAPRDCVYYDILSSYLKDSQVISFGQHPEATLRYLGHTSLSSGMDHIHVSWQGHPLSYHLPSVGKHWIWNSLCILAGIAALGEDVQGAAASLSTFWPLPGRGERLKIGQWLIIDDTYNAAPAAMKASLQHLKNLPAPRHIAFLGEMRELDFLEEESHDALYEDLLFCDKIFLCGPAMSSLYQRLPSEKRGGYASNVEELRELLQPDFFKAGDAILLKGANGTQMWSLLPFFKMHAQEPLCSIG